ncbi:sulfite exporter TauE/SafE family protein [Sediminibacillus terrae]|uniref:sulfite exporter TauE/SafE family protein n=1 Tax=Sediminibacillus terrae TaxID=1562106 RepID=UPI0012962259|nr:sulfite exporter TauE/SafE family protein [Sediminibacillus terrae]
MNRTALTITRIYQFTSESVLIYLLAVPFLWVFRMEYSFWHYLLLVCIQALIGLLILQATAVMAPLITLSIAVAAMAVIVFHIPWPAAVLTGVLLCWRFIKHQENADHQHEKAILGLSFFLLAVYLLLSTDFTFLAIGLVQFLLIMCGFLLRNIFSMDKDRGFGVYIVSGTIGVFAAAGIVIALLYNGARSIYLFVGGLLSSLAGGAMAALLSPFDLEPDLKKTERDGNSMEQNQGAEDPMPDRPEEFNGETVDRIFHFLEWLVIIGAVVLIVWIILKLYRKRVQVETADSDNSMVTYESLSDQDQQNGWRLFKRRKPQLDDTVRQLFLEFELFAAKLGLGRERFESIEDWFRRIDLQVDDTELYQRVRYGDEQLEEEKITEFREEIARLTSRLQEK